MHQKSAGRGRRSHEVVGFGHSRRPPAQSQQRRPEFRVVAGTIKVPGQSSQKARRELLSWSSRLPPQLYKGQRWRQYDGLPDDPPTHQYV